MKVNVRDIRRTDHIPVLFVRFLAKCLREDVFKHILADRILESAFDDADGGFSGPESGQMRLLLTSADDVLRFVIHLVQRDDDFDLRAYSLR